jgi:hypothetical protein
MRPNMPKCGYWASRSSTLRRTLTFCRKVGDIVAAKQRIRYSRQQHQERISRTQFETYLERAGWICDNLYDLGEDLLVRIYDDGVWTGLTLFIQLKSTQDLDEHLVHGDRVSYPIEVKDLLHWRDSATPVFIVVWDVNRQAGKWISVDETLRDLGVRKTGWESQTEVSVHIPVSHEVDVAGLQDIRRLVADHYYPSVAQGKALTIRTVFQFPLDQAGIAALDAVERYASRGDPVEIPGKYIQEVEFSPWWRKLYGNVDFTSGSITLGPAKPARVIPMQVRFEATDGSHGATPFLRMAVEKAGLEEVTLSNHGQQAPLEFQIVLGKSDHRFEMTLTVCGPGQDAVQSLEILRFLRAFALGGQLRLLFLESDDKFEAVIPAGLINSPARELLELVEDLCVVQAKTRTNLQLPADWRFTHGDLEMAHDLVKILETGVIDHRGMTVKLEMLKIGIEQIIGLQPSDEPGHLRISYEESWAELLSTKIPLGPWTREITGRLVLPSEDMGRLLANLAPDATAEVKIVDAEIVETYPNWTPDKTMRSLQ